MNSGVYLTQPDGSLAPLAERRLGEIVDLQPLLERAPQLLSGDRSEEWGGWLLVQRELGVVHGDGEGPRWSVDHLFLDAEGTPTLVEVKHSSNTEIRRQVVGQLLEYAANFANYWTAERIRASFEARCEAIGADPAGLLRDATGTEDTVRFWESVDEKIAARRLRLFFVADTIPSELRQIIEFLNEEMHNLEVLGLEIKEHAGEGGALVTARTIGATEAAESGKGRGSARRWRKWDRDSYLARLREERGENEAQIVERLLGWAHDHDPPLDLSWGTGIHSTSAQIGIKASDAYAFPFLIYTNGAVEVGFQWMISAPYPPFHRLDKRQALRSRLEAIPGVTLSMSRIDLRPSFPLALLRAEDSFSKFLETFEWVIQEAIASGVGLDNLETATAERNRPD